MDVYAFDVPPGKRELAVGLQLTDAADTVDAVLIDPTDQAIDAASNITLGENGLTTESAVQMFQPRPVPGRWRVAVVVQQSVVGTALEKPFHGTVTFDAVQTGSTGLPQSPTTVLRAGQAYTAQVTVHNSGVQTLALGVNPRLNQQQEMSIAPFYGAATFALPLDPRSAVYYVVPPDTSAVVARARSTLPAQVELATQAAGTDVFGSLDRAQGGGTTSTASVFNALGTVPPGIWDVRVDEVGPYPDAGPPPGSTEVRTTVWTDAFDTSISTDTDDPYRILVDPSADGFGTPVLVRPGESAVIAVRIVPSGHPRTVVSGHLNLVTEWGMLAGPYSPFNTTGETVASIPYTYTVG
jgi:hypothetical protein